MVQLIWSKESKVSPKNNIKNSLVMSGQSSQVMMERITFFETTNQTREALPSPKLAEYSVPDRCMQQT